MCWCLSTPYLSSAMPGCAACALVTGAPSACVRTSSTLSCCRRSGPNSTLWYSEGPLYLLILLSFFPFIFSSFILPFFATLLNFVAPVSNEFRIKVAFICKTFTYLFIISFHISPFPSVLWIHSFPLKKPNFHLHFLCFLCKLPFISIENTSILIPVPLSFGWCWMPCCWFLGLCCRSPAVSSNRDVITHVGSCCLSWL